MFRLKRSWERFHTKNEKTTQIQNLFAKKWELKVGFAETVPISTKNKNISGTIIASRLRALKRLKD